MGTWVGEFDVPSYRTGGFLDPKGRGMYTGYDQAVALPALQADGKDGQEELFKETNKVFDIGKGAIEMEVNKVNQDLGEIGGVFSPSSRRTPTWAPRRPRPSCSRASSTARSSELEWPCEAHRLRRDVAVRGARPLDAAVGS